MSVRGQAHSRHELFVCVALIAWIARLNVVIGDDEKEDNHAKHIGANTQNLNVTKRSVDEEK